MERKDSYYVPNLGQTVEAGEYAGQRDIEIMALKKQAGKNNNAFIMGMRNLDEPVPVGLFDGYVERKVKEKGVNRNSSAWEATKGFFEGFIKSPVRWTGYAATNSLPLIAKTATTLYALGSAKGGVEKSDKWVREANKGIEAWSKEVQRLTGIDDADTVESVIGNALGSVFGSVGIGGVFGGASVAPMFGASALQDTYTRQREKGTGVGESLIRGGIHGTGEAVLERLQFNRIFGNLAKKSKPIAIIKDLLENSMQEGLQQATEQGANWNIDNRKLIEKLQEIAVSMAGGAIASLGGSVGGNILNRNTINEVGDLMKKTGHTDEEIQSVKENLNKIVDTDELERASNQVAKDELTTIALTYKEQAQEATDILVKELNDTIGRNELVNSDDIPTDIEGMKPLYQLGDIQIDTEKNPNLGMVLYQAEQTGQPIQTLGQVLEWTKGKLNVEQAQKMITGINAVYNNTYEQLKALGQDDVFADSNARVRSAMAFSIAKNFGVSVEEANNMLGGIVSQKEADFSAMEKQNEVLKQSMDIARENERLDKIYPKYTGETLDINGVEKTVYNSSGERIAQSKEALQNFYKWFGDSKVVDEQGRPLVVYHRTENQFSSFDKRRTRKQWGRSGFFFSKDDLSSFGDVNIPVYLNARNILEIDAKNKLWALLPLEGELAQNVKRITLKNDKYASALYSIDALTGYAKEQGYDGVIVRNIKEGDNLGTITDTYTVFNPTQIKSIDNRGTYSPTEGNIYKQSAYAGSRVDYDKPSLEAMGSGQGIQTHGWGLYYTLNKNVADEYRKEFIKTKPFKYIGKDYLSNTYREKIEDYGLDYIISLENKDLEKMKELKYKKSDIEEQNNFIKKLEALKEYVVENEGQVHEVDIPEPEFLLDEQKTLAEQSDYVKNALSGVYKEVFGKKLSQEYQRPGVPGFSLYRTGFDIYREISYDVGSDKKASKILEKHGIKGITYDGRQDGRCFVIFNPDDVKVIHKFYQDEANPRGAYYNNTVYLFENANESTFVHEMAHSYMDVLEQLASNGNIKAQSDLNVIRNWLSKKQGQAFTQTDWERFARGFEMYMREGKSPNQYLGGEKGVFARFRDWLMHIYAGIKTLRVKNEKGVEEPVRINNQIRRFYDEMLGGTSIDEVFDTAEKNQQSLEVLDNKLKQLAESQQKLAEEKAKLVREMANNVKPDTTLANVKDWGNNVWESAKELPINVLQSSYERLAKIDPRLGLLVQKAEQSQGLRLKKWADEIKPFYEAFNKLSNEDKAKLQFYLLNQQWGDVDDILGKEGTEAVHGMLEEIYNELQDSGVEVGYRDNYFPRAVLDYDGLLQEMGLTYPSLRKEMEEALGKDATPQEQAEWLDKHIMGFKGNVSLNQNRNTKERKLELITDRMAKYYKPSMETLVDYMNGMAKLLSMREAFGRDIEYKDSTAEDSIGKIINRLFGDNKFTKKEIDEVREVLSALYLPNGMGNKFIQAMRQYGYATKLSYSTTVRQFADIGMMIKVNGVLNTLEALFHPDERITLEKLGIDPLGEEFQTSKKDIGGKIANFATKWKGINWADAVMKNAFMRSNYKKLQKLAKTPDKFHQKYDSMFGDEVDTLIKDLNDDKISEPVKVLLFHEISKIQPISRSAMPTAYLSNPNGRVFYMFKTFSLHRAEYMFSELADDFRRGDYKKAGKDIMADVGVIGWEGLVELLIAFLKYGWQAMATGAILETFAGTGLEVFGLNKHQALQITRGQIGDFFQQMVGVGTPFDDIGYMIRHYDETDKLLRALLPDMILEPLIVGPKPISNRSKKLK